MGVMMWMMRPRRRREQEPGGQSPPDSPAQPASLEVLREEHERLGRQIDRLEAAGHADQRE
jgi:hypothetical protein